MPIEPSVRCVPPSPKQREDGYTRDRRAHVRARSGLRLQRDEEAVLECLIMADVDVLEVESEDDRVTVIAPNTEFAKARNA